MTKYMSCLVLTLVLLCSAPLYAQNYQYMTAEQVKEKLSAKQALTLVDIQVADEYQQHHIDGSVATYAYPVKSSEDKGKLAAITTELSSNQDEIVIICPRGAGGAERTYSYLQTQGIAQERLYILEKGQAGWPYPELLAPAP